MDARGTLCKERHFVVLSIKNDERSKSLLNATALVIKALAIFQKMSHPRPFFVYFRSF